MYHDIFLTGLFKNAVSLLRNQFKRLGGKNVFSGSDTLADKFCPASGRSEESDCFNIRILENFIKIIVCLCSDFSSILIGTRLIKVTDGSYIEIPYEI